MRLSLTCERACIAQVDSKLTSFVTALSEVSSMDGRGVDESEISSLTDVTYGSGSRGEAECGCG